MGPLKTTLFYNSFMIIISHSFLVSFTKIKLKKEFSMFFYPHIKPSMSLLHFGVAPHPPLSIKTKQSFKAPCLLNSYDNIQTISTFKSYTFFSMMSAKATPIFLKNITINFALTITFISANKLYAL